MNEHSVENFVLRPTPMPIVVLAKSLAHNARELVEYSSLSEFHDDSYKVHPDDVAFIVYLFSLPDANNRTVFVAAVPESDEDRLFMFQKLCEMNALFTAHIPSCKSLGLAWLNFIDTHNPKTCAHMHIRTMGL